MSGNGKIRYPNISIIKHKGDPNVATTLDGYTVKRVDKIFVLPWERFVMVAPYDNHFIYEDPSKQKNRWWAMCTCGAPAVVVGYKAYEQDASPTDSGELVVCYFHANGGRHADGSK